jgi:hypothetical protein
MKITSATLLLNDMTALSKGNFSVYKMINDIKKEIYYLYTFEDDIDIDTFYKICLKNLDKLDDDVKKEAKDKLREIKLNALGI